MAEPDISGTAGRRGRPRKVESYADWMARIDGQVDAMARRMSPRSERERQGEQQPSYAHPARRIASRPSPVTYMADAERRLVAIAGSITNYLKALQLLRAETNMDKARELTTIIEEIEDGSLCKTARALVECLEQLTGRDPFEE